MDKLIPNCMVLQPRGQPLSYMPFSEPQILLKQSEIQCFQDSENMEYGSSTTWDVTLRFVTNVKVNSVYKENLECLFESGSRKASFLDYSPLLLPVFLT
jgi:hypothetical protein